MGKTIKATKTEPKFKAGREAKPKAKGLNEKVADKMKQAKTKAKVGRPRKLSILVD